MRWWMVPLGLGLGLGLALNLTWAGSPGHLATSFEANRGQFEPDVRYAHVGGDLDVRVRSDGTLRVGVAGWEGSLVIGHLGATVESIAGTGERVARANLYIGANPRGWITGVPLYEGVRLDPATPGAPIAMSADGRRVVLEVRVEPGTDLASLRFGFAGGDSYQAGDAVAIPVPGGTLRLTPRVVPHSGAGASAGARAAFRRLDDTAWSLQAKGVSADGRFSVVTEIEVERATSRLGPSHDDDPHGRDDDVRLALTADGGTLVAGTVERRRGVRDGFVAKLGKDRSALEWVAYLGGAGDTRLAGIVGDSRGAPSVVGSTTAADFPSMIAVQPSAGGGLDAFVTRLAADGSALEFSTLLGGEGSDGATAVALAPDGTLRVSGATTSRGTPFGVRDAGDAFLAIVDPVASRSETLLVDRGGVEVASALALDERGTTFLAGTSRDGDRARAFAAVVGASGEVHAFAVGGDDQDGAATALAVDSRGGAWIAGWRRLAERVPMLAALSPTGQVRELGDDPGPAEPFAGLALGADARGNVWLAEGSSGGVVVSRLTTGDSTRARREVVRVGGIDRIGAIAVGTDDTILVAGADRDGDVAGGDLVGPLASGGTAVIAEAGGGPVAPLAAGCPGTINFDNSAGTSLWGTAANWDLDRLPSGTDDVCIGPGLAVQSAGTQAAGTIFVSATSSLTVTSGTLTFGAASEIDGALTLQTGAITGTGDLTIDGLFTWTAGMLSGVGTTHANGGMSIGGGGTKDVTSSRVLNVSGATTWSGVGQLRIGTGSSINNTGTWTCQSDASMNVLSGSPLFNNNAPGIFRKSVATGTTTVAVAFNNTSSVDIQAGTVTFNGNGTHTGSFAGAPGTTLRFGGGTHALQSTSSVSASTVDIAGGTVSVNGTYLATSETKGDSGGTITFNAAATVTGIGATLTAAGAAFNFNSGEAISPATMSLSGGTVGGTDTFNVSGLLTWTGGAMSGAGTTNANGGMSLGGAGTKDVTSSRVLNVSGATNWSGVGQLRLGTGSSINNTGTWTCQSDAAMNVVSGSPVFNNNTPGIFRKAGTTGITTVSVAFNNASSVDIQAGTVTFNGNGTHTGSFAGAPGTTLRFGGGTHTLQAASSISASTVDIVGGTVSVNGTYLATSETKGDSGGTITFNSAATVTGIGATLTAAGAAFNFNSGEAISPTTMSLSAGSVGGTDTLNISGLLTWTGGQMSGAGTTNANGGMSLGGAGTKDVTSSRVLNVSGATTWSGSGQLRIGTGSSINNTGTWTCESDASMNVLSGSPVFNNNAPGIFRKSLATGTTTVSVSFNNASSVDVQAGTVIFNGSGTHSGSFTGAPGTTLRIGGGTHTLQATSSVSASTIDIVGGTVSVNGTYLATNETKGDSGGTITFNPAATVTGIGATLTAAGAAFNFNSGEAISPATMSVSAGTVGGTDTIHVSDLLTWVGGTMSGAGTTNVSGAMSIAGAGTKDLTSSRALHVSGVTTWSGIGQLRLGPGSSITNTGTWTCANDAPLEIFSGTPAFHNVAPGTFRKLGGAGTTSVLMNFTNSGTVEALSGTLSFANGYPQTAGTTTQNGGVLTSPTPLDIQGGVLQGTGTIAAGVISSGQVRPGLSSGTLGTSGSYTQSGGGSFAVEIGGLLPGTGHDRLEVNGTATLAGALAVTLVGGFVPAAGDEFTILTCASRSGTFATTSFPALPGGLSWRVDYFADSVKLVVLSVPVGRVPGDLPTETPLRVAKSGSSLALTWSATCVGTDVDFGVYEGSLGAFTSHVPVQCTTGGATSTTFTPAAGNRYYLVVATNGFEDGSYGLATGSTERPQSASACNPQHLAKPCP